MLPPPAGPCPLGQRDTGHGQSSLKVLEESEDSCVPHAGWRLGSLHADPAQALQLRRAWRALHLPLGYLLSLLSRGTEEKYCLQLELQEADTSRGIGSGRQ